jgi:hypothetical protein
MIGIKFTCPSCGQHVECDASHAGENFPCPACAAVVHVPADTAFAEASAPAAATNASPSLSKELGKVFYEPELSSEITHRKPAESAEQSGSPAAAVNQSAAGLTAGNSHPNGNGELRSEVRCVCPVCKSDLRISLELAMPATSDTQHLSLEEREQQIAAAREANPVSLHPGFKPRLDKILGDSENKEAA